MNEKFESSIVSGGFLKSKMSDISTESEYDENSKLVSGITQNKVDVYTPAVSFNNRNYDNLDSKYITKFLEE